MENVTMSPILTDAIWDSSWFGNDSNVMESSDIQTQSNVSMSADWLWEPITWSWWLICKIACLGLGIMGNFLVILVLFERRKSRSAADALIGNLAAADFLTSVLLIPIPRAARVPPTWLGELYCRVVHPSVLMWLCIYTSTLTLMAISLDRYFAIVHPIKFMRYRKRRTVDACILFLWATSLTANLYIPLTLHVDDASKKCKVMFNSYNDQVVVGVVMFFICFIIPTVVMLVTQITAARVLNRQFKRFHRPTSDFSTASSKLLIAKVKVLRMLIVVVVLFIICWGPNSVAFFLYNIRVLDSTYLYGPVDRLLVLLTFCNSCANPIVYTLQHPQFRQAVKSLFTCSTKRRNALFEFHPSTTLPGKVLGTTTISMSFATSTTTISAVK